MALDPHQRTRLLRRRRERSAGSDMSAAVNAVHLDAPSAATHADAAARDARVVPASFDALFDTHYERLVRALTVVAGDREVAADAVQDAFVKAHLHWSKISRYDDPSGWVRRVAINRLRDEHRREQRKRRVIRRVRSEPTAPNEVPEIDEFARLLAELPRQQRLTTALYYVDNLTVAEIAGTLGISDGTVKSNLHDARRRLRPILENEAHHD